jgi:hypothetical protein
MMKKLFFFLITNFGLPILANQIQEKTDKISSQLALLKFVTHNKKRIVKIISIGLSGVIFTSIGLCLIAFSTAQYFDMGLPNFLTATFITSCAIFLLGASLAGSAWKMTGDVEKHFYAITHASKEPQSFFKTIFNAFVNGLLDKPSSSSSEYSDSEEDQRNYVH